MHCRRNRNPGREGRQTSSKQTRPPSTCSRRQCQEWQAPGRGRRQAPGRRHRREPEAHQLQQQTGGTSSTRKTRGREEKSFFPDGAQHRITARRTGTSRERQPGRQATQADQGQVRYPRVGPVRYKGRRSLLQMKIFSMQI